MNTTIIEFEINASGWTLEELNDFIKKIRETHEDKCELRIKIKW